MSKIFIDRVTPFPHGFSLSVAGATTPGTLTMYYMGHDVTWWRERIKWFNLLHADQDEFMPVSELMLEEFFITYGNHLSGFTAELERVFKFWDKRSDLDGFLCG